MAQERPPARSGTELPVTEGYPYELRLPEAPHNLAWGGDGHDLYVTALTSVYRLRLTTKGATP